MCGWLQDSKDDGDWIRNNLGTASYNTGPKSDHTTHADDLSEYLVAPSPRPSHSIREPCYFNPNTYFNLTLHITLTPIVTLP